MQLKFMDWHKKATFLLNHSDSKTTRKFVKKIFERGWLTMSQLYRLNALYTHTKKKLTRDL